MSGDNQYGRRAIVQYYEIILKRSKHTLVSMENYCMPPHILPFIAMRQNVALFHQREASIDMWQKLRNAHHVIVP